MSIGSSARYSAREIARVCHEANRALQFLNDDPAVGVAPPWEETSTETQLSVIDGVYGILADKTPEQSHDNWCDFKRQHGWVYGPVKDEGAKTHPCLVPYDELSPGDRVKDALFSNIVKALSGS